MPPSLTFAEIKQKMVNYCVYQDRCHSEVEQKMREFLLIPEAREEILIYLIKENYLNEERFTRSYIRGRFSIKHWGRNKIRQHLKLKGISDKLIMRCMDEIDDGDYNRELLKQYETYFAKQKGLQPYQKKTRTIKYLMSRGFSYGEILAVTDAQD